MSEDGGDVTNLGEVVYERSKAIADAQKAVKQAFTILAKVTKGDHELAAEFISATAEVLRVDLSPWPVAAQATLHVKERYGHETTSDRNQRRAFQEGESHLADLKARLQAALDAADWDAHAAKWGAFSREQAALERLNAIVLARRTDK